MTIEIAGLWIDFCLLVCNNILNINILLSHLDLNELKKESI